MIDQLFPQFKPFRQSAGCYWQQSRRPLAGLVFILPLLALYEVGLLLLGPSAVRNGADVWLRSTLGWVGFGNYFLLPVLTIGALLAWHHTTRDTWRISPSVLYWMIFESALLGWALLAIAHLQGSLVAMLGTGEQGLAALSLNEAMHWFGQMVGFFGAGIYEEVLFRLLLLPAVAALITAVGGSLRVSVVGSVIATSLIFSIAHYVGAHGEVFAWYSFVFRTLAGGFFAALFVYRGFGIAAGTHALYDVFVGMF